LRGRSLFLATLLLIILSAFAFSTKTSMAQSEVVIYVSPDTVSVAPGESFDIMVNIKRAENVYSWQFSLSWDPTILELQEVSEGNFLNQGIFPTIWSEDNYVDNDAGNGTLFCILQAQPRSSSASGDGTLATVTFYVKDEGYSALSLYNTELLDYDYYKLPHMSESGVFQSPQAEIPLLRVELPSIENPLTINSTFDANITIVNVANLYSWTACLSWDPTVLNATDVHEGLFLSQDGTQATTFDVTYPEAGIVCVNCTLISQPIVTAAGNGTLATITFSVENYGISLLDLHNTTLLDSNLVEIPHLSEDSYFTYPMLGDISVKSIEASIYNITVGDSVSITIMVENQGNVEEPFDVLVWANITLVRIIPVTDLESGDQKTLTLDWSTQNIAGGRYVIKVEADTVPGETDTDDNTLIMDNAIQATAQSETQFPTTLAIAAVAIIVLLAIIMFYFVRRKRSPKV
jgi:archaellum component FlaG (FlaF/FlaG flagellin family)